MSKSVPFTQASFLTIGLISLQSIVDWFLVTKFTSAFGLVDLRLVLLVVISESWLSQTSGQGLNGQ